MKKFLVILCLCSLLFAFAGCSGTAPVATEASTVTETTAESTPEATTTAESTTEATASSTDVETEEPIKEIQYTVPIDRIHMSILWFYKFTVDPSVCQVSFTSPENWIPGEVMSKVEESALYNLSDGSAALAFRFASDIANEPYFPYTTENGTAYSCSVYGDYNAEQFSCEYEYSVKISDQVRINIRIYGNFGRETADRYAFPILDSLSFPDEAVYYSDEDNGDAYTAFKEVKINKEFELAWLNIGSMPPSRPSPQICISVCRKLGSITARILGMAAVKGFIPEISPKIGYSRVIRNLFILPSAPTLFFRWNGNLRKNGYMK